ncbi:unnamed protein product [Meganyctiphanes norvegica]|uniref:RING-type domain-containing protein n=1 Tax=Meganyctiphanes norvegica TaxID=48144 RepID=A0AAV2QFL8_MEGNR
MDITDEDEDFILGSILGDRSRSSPAGMQAHLANEFTSQDSVLVNDFNINTLSGASATGFASSLFKGYNPLGVPPKRCTSSESYELQDFDLRKRKRLQRVHSDQHDRRITYKGERDCFTSESATSSKGSQIGTAVNDLVTRASTIDQKFDQMTSKIENMQLEIKGLKSGNSTISDGLKSITDQNKRLSERIEQLEVNGLCVVCYKDKINIWVDPCHHWVMCATCYKKLSATLDENTGTRLKKCPVCRANINYALPYYGI